MSECPNGCVDGLIWVDENTAVPCKHCLGARNRAEFRGDYSPAGLTPRARFSRLQRARARRSVAKRRQLAKGKPPRRRERTRELALARAYPKLAQVSREQFARMYEAAAGRHGWKLDRRGVNTAWELYGVLWRHYRTFGQDFEITNGQLAVALERAGRPRQRRTIQLTRKRLEAMGLLAFAWVKRGTWRKDRGWCPGERKDTIRVTALHVKRANCTPPTGAGTSGLRPSVSRSAGESPPPSAVENVPPFGGNGQLTREASVVQATPALASARSPSLGSDDPRSVRSRQSTNVRAFSECDGSEPPDPLASWHRNA